MFKEVVFEYFGIVIKAEVREPTNGYKKHSIVIKNSEKIADCFLQSDRIYKKIKALALEKYYQLKNEN